MEKNMYLKVVDDYVIGYSSVPIDDYNLTTNIPNDFDSEGKPLIYWKHDLTFDDEKYQVDLLKEKEYEEYIKLDRELKQIQFDEFVGVPMVMQTSIIGDKKTRYVELKNKYNF